MEPVVQYRVRCGPSACWKIPVVPPSQEGQECSEQVSRTRRRAFFAAVGECGRGLSLGKDGLRERRRRREAMDEEGEMVAEVGEGAKLVVLWLWLALEFSESQALWALREKVKFTLDAGGLGPRSSLSCQLHCTIRRRQCGRVGLGETEDGLLPGSRVW